MILPLWCVKMFRLCERSHEENQRGKNVQYIVFNIHPCCVNTWVEGVEPSIQGQGDCDLSVNRRKHEDSNSLQTVLCKAASYKR